MANHFVPLAEAVRLKRGHTYNMRLESEGRMSHRLGDRRVTTWLWLSEHGEERLIGRWEDRVGNRYVITEAP